MKSRITFTLTVFKVCALIFQYAYMLLQGHVSNPKIALKVNLLSVSTTTTINYTTLTSWSDHHVECSLKETT